MVTVSHLCAVFSPSDTYHLHCVEKMALEFLISDDGVYVTVKILNPRF
jgi:hypothetical protein